MKITRRQLRKIINESIKIRESAAAYSAADSDLLAMLGPVRDVLSGYGVDMIKRISGVQGAAFLLTPFEFSAPYPDDIELGETHPVISFALDGAGDLSIQFLYIHRWEGQMFSRDTRRLNTIMNDAFRGLDPEMYASQNIASIKNADEQVANDIADALSQVLSSATGQSFIAGRGLQEIIK